MLLPMLGYGITFAYRSARPDALCVVLVALLLLASTLSSHALRRAAVIGVSAVLPWAGLQLVAYAAIGSCLIVLYTGRRHMRTLLWVMTGLVTGGCLMLAFYAANGHLQDFIFSTVGSQQTLLGQLGQYVVLDDQRGTGRFTPFRILMAIIQDPSSTIGLMTAVLLLASVRVRRSPEAISRLVASIGAGVLIPCGLYVVGKYPIYYTWMGLLVIWFLIFAALDRIEASARLERLGTCGLLMVALLTGWPFLVGSAIFDSQGRDYGQVQRFVGQVVHPGDWACISPEAYFAVIEIGGTPFHCTLYATSRLAPNFPQAQQQRISVIVVTPRDSAESIARLPGHWIETASLHMPTKIIPWLSWLYNDGLSDSYDLVAYRRG